jgi:hypothetical protein
MFVLGKHDPISKADGQQQARLIDVKPMAEAGFWIAWGLPTQGREVQALDLLNEARGYLERLANDGQIERVDIALLKPQTTELGGFLLVQGTQEQIDALRHDEDFQVWVNRLQLVAGRVGIVDAWVGDGITEATDLYKRALRKAGLSD